MLKVVIVDDHPLLAKGLKVVLEEETVIEVVAMATSGTEAVRLAIELRPDVVVMDVQLPDMDGIEATRLIKQRAPEIKVLGLSGFDDDEAVMGMIKAGANGYVLKDASFDEIVVAIHEVSLGQTYFSPGIARAAFWRLHWKDDTQQSNEGSNFGLTRREREVLGLLSQGLGNQEIAQSLVISKRTAENHVRSMYKKLGVRTRSQALLQAIRVGLIKSNKPKTG